MAPTLQINNVAAMDFWSRLVGSVGGSLPAKQASTNDPNHRLHHFKKVHNQVLIWQKKLSLPIDSATTEKAVCNLLETLTGTLQDEIRSPAPHPCIVYVSSAQVYSVVASIAQSLPSEQTIHVALDFFNLLVDNEEGGFVEDGYFADALIKIFDSTSSSIHSPFSPETEGHVAELLFGVAAKVRLHPEILPIWFRPAAEGNGPSRTAFDSSTTTSSNRQDFPLFYALIEYVHHDGRVGDFARTGLLYLLGAAAHAEDLEKWVVESELPTLMASGLGALYSRLSRKLVLSYAEDSVPAIVAFSEVQMPSLAFDVEVTGSPEFQAVLGTFLSYLVFWQDVLEQCPSKDVKLTLLDHFKLLFLRQLLYPSLLESSDVDGGSSVAVLTYLRYILESIHYPDLVRLIMQYLLAIPEHQLDDSSGSRPTTLARRRKSHTLRTDLAKGEEKPSPDLFTLVDLILTSLRSHNQQTITATLRLCSVIMSRQHSYAISTLVRVHKPDSGYQRTLNSHNFHLDTLLSMAEDLALDDGLEESYETHLQDARTHLEAHSCSAQLLALPGMDAFMTHDVNMVRTSIGPKPMTHHIIATDDPLLLHLLSLLKNFLVNDIETNLSLTQLFSVLASCGYICIKGWLVADKDEDCFTSEQDVYSGENTGNNEDRFPSDADENLAKEHKTSRQAHPTPFRSSSPPSLILATFNSLIKQVDSLRQKIQDFDIFLAERRHIFKVGEDMESALADTSAPSRKSEDSNSVSSKQQQQKPNHLISLSQRFLSEATSSNASRASSPRGRQQQQQQQQQQDDPPSSSALTKKLNYLKTSPSPSPSKSGPGSRAYSASPFRRDASPSKCVTPMGPPDALRQKIKLSATHTTSRNNHPTQDTDGSEASSTRSGSIELGGGGGGGGGGVRTEGGRGGAGGEDTPDEIKEISLGHLLTNIIILQEFMLELAALIEVRASLFGEVI